MRVIIFMPDELVDTLVTDAIRLGYMRENPRKAWADWEKRAAIRWLAIKLLVKTQVEQP